MTPEQLAAIRERVRRNDEARQFFVRQPIEADLAALLAEVDRLRSGIDDAEHALWEAWVEGGDTELIDRARDDLEALLNPEETP